MRLRAKRDANEKAVVDALEAAGCLVERLNDPGVPDLAVYHWATGRFMFMEVKDCAKPPSRRTLKLAQVQFFARWRPTKVAYVVTSAGDALACLQASVADVDVLNQEPI